MHGPSAQRMNVPLPSGGSIKFSSDGDSDDVGEAIQGIGDVLVAICLVRGGRRESVRS